MKKLFVVSSALLVTALAAAPARAGDDLSPDPVTSRSEFYLGLILPYNALGGNLDGKRLYTGPDGDAIVPNPRNALGAGIAFGVKSDRSSGRGLALEGSLQGSHHQSDTSGGPASNLGLVSADFKFFPTTRGNLQPWLQLGVCLASLEVDDGFFSNGQRKNETFTGDGLNLGAGLLAYASPHVALHLAAIYRFIHYTDVDYGVNRRLDPRLHGDMLSVELGLSFRIHRD